MSIVIIIVIIIIACFGVATFFINKEITSLYRQITISKETTILLHERFIDHLHWTNDLLESILTETNFTGETDPTQSTFGKWYYSLKNSNKFKDLTSKQKNIFKKCFGRNGSSNSILQ